MKTATLSTLVPSVLLAMLAGCAAATPAPTAQPSPTPAPVILQYIGNSCTLITAPDGTRIVSDPYGDSSHPTGIGPLPKGLVADAVTVSHAHPDHNNVKGVGGTPQLITVPGTFQVGMVQVIGYEGREGSPYGPSDMPETIIVIEIGGVKIVHLGDSGIITQTEVLAAIENADVLIVNIDGYVIPSDKLVPFFRQIKARTIIPAHYSLSEGARWQGAPTIDEFVKTLPADLAVVRKGSEMEVTPNMPKQVAVLTPLTLIK